LARLEQKVKQVRQVAWVNKVDLDLREQKDQLGLLAHRGPWDQRVRLGKPAGSVAGVLVVSMAVLANADPWVRKGIVAHVGLLAVQAALGIVAPGG